MRAGETSCCTDSPYCERGSHSRIAASLPTAPAAAELAEPHTVAEKVAATWQQARSSARGALGAAKAWVQQTGAQAGDASKDAARHVRAAAAAAKARMQAAVAGAMQARK